jgi:hypothetical protein
MEAMGKMNSSIQLVQPHRSNSSSSSCDMSTDISIACFSSACSADALMSGSKLYPAVHTNA